MLGGKNITASQRWDLFLRSTSLSVDKIEHIISVGCFAGG